MKTIYETAKQYYPRLWNEFRIEQLVSAGRLTREEADEIISSSNNDGT